MKFLVFLFFLVNFCFLNAEESDGYSDSIIDYDKVISYEYDHLYLESVDPDVYETMDTITYYISEKNYASNALASAFELFSKDIGVKNGAVYLSLENGVITKNKSNTFDYINASTCDPMTFKKESIIVEFRNRSSCIRIPTLDQSIVISVLVMVKRNIGNFDDIKERSNMIKLIESIKAELTKRNIPAEHYEVAESFLMILKNKLHDIIQGSKVSK